jgi:hypothetical protein
MPVVAAPKPAPSFSAEAPPPRATAPEPRERDRDRDRDWDRDRSRDRDRPRFGGRDRPRDRGRPSDRDRPRFGERDRDRGRGPGPSPSPGDDRPARRHERRPPPPLRNDQPPAEREFWEVWSEERAQAQGGADAPPASEPSETPFETTSPGIGEAGRDDAPNGDVARLYLNLGRKDGASEKEIRDLLTTYAGSPDVKDIDVMNTHTYLNVAPADAERIITSVTGKELGGRQLVCETAKPRRR